MFRLIGIAPVTCRWIQAERTSEQVDAGGNDRRSDAVVVEDQRLDEVIQVALVIRDVDDPPRFRRLLRDFDVLVDAFDLPQDRIEGVLEGAVDGIPLRRPQLVEVRMDPLTRLSSVWPGPPRR